MTFVDDVLAFRDEYVSLRVMPEVAALRRDLAVRTAKEKPDGFRVVRAGYELLQRELRMDEHLKLEELECSLDLVDLHIQLRMLDPTTTAADMHDLYEQRQHYVELLAPIEGALKEDGWLPEECEFAVITQGTRPVSPAQHYRAITD